MDLGTCLRPSGKHECGRAATAKWIGATTVLSRRARPLTLMLNSIIVADALCFWALRHDMCWRPRSFAAHTWAHDFRLESRKHDHAVNSVAHDGACDAMISAKFLQWSVSSWCTCDMACSACK